ncbi:YkgJ family cysteine cluster protein [Terasakiispira papahanaumokuakeensis]|uniref:YkgJ family cysteine cluster protein n=1 Tax=Terasakiispira papahanaumokuakeensis TaxID=197479 RepID=UPI000A00EB31|nr:YkgJ family cysteine cluster protein [Terasakiispira papahanaumokuakeensis]
MTISENRSQESHRCRPGCGACCIAPSINTPFMGMSEGKPAGTPCIHLTVQWQCAIFGQPERPKTCRDFNFDLSVCGSDRDQALDTIQVLEVMTMPG